MAWRCCRDRDQQSIDDKAPEGARGEARQSCGISDSELALAERRQLGCKQRPLVGAEPMERGMHSHILRSLMTILDRRSRPCCKGERRASCLSPRESAAIGRGGESI